jgi:alanyl-tRNA synthetase
MVKTKELYYESAYTDEFDATVTSCEKGDNGSFFVSLDATVFFPEQGGQGCDGGFITDESGRSHEVRHVAIQDGVVIHVIDEEIQPGTRVHGRIDFAHRFGNMQQHTGEHIFSGIVNSRFGYDNVGFHLSDSEVTMDYSGPISDEDIRKIELAVNEAIWQNVAVRCEFPSDEELEGIDYRSKKELSGQIRIVTVEGYDVCACCAPHVLSTGEIGLLKVVGCQNYKGGVRVSILCGKRALFFIQGEHDILSDISKSLTTSADKVMASVQKMHDENRDLKLKLSECQEKLLSYELSEIDESLEDVLMVKDPSMDGNLMRKTVNALAERHQGYCGIFSGSDQEGYKYIIASGKMGKDARNVQNALREGFGAKGGGSSAMIQGSMTGAVIAEVLSDLGKIK